jgi:MoCo/4Fe-4S cofactor protein with predicted Tat translocation signal
MTNGPKYWRSLEELDRSPAFEEALNKEFAEEVESGTLDGATRRHFLGIMGASLAMTSMAGCVRRPVDKIVPYTKAPEDVLPGMPNHYATAANVGGSVIGMLVESHEGRPTKIEGNPEHPGGFGGTNAMHQGMVLDLYDPMRLKVPHKDKAPSDWQAAETFIRSHFLKLRDGSGKGLAILTEALPSPSFDHVRQRMRATFPQATWHTFESISEENQRVGLNAAFGKALRPVYRLNKARVVVSLDSDFLSTDGDSVENARAWASLRHLEQPGDDMSRLYAVEGHYSLTGTNADHRLRIAPSQVEAVAFALAAAFKAKGAAIPPDIAGAAAARSEGLDDKAKAFVAAVADDLWNRRTPAGTQRNGLIIPGRRQPAVVHAVAAALNHALGAQGVTVYYYNDMSRVADEAGDMTAIKNLTTALNKGDVETLLVLGGNPAYAAPGDLDFGAAMAKAKTSICLSDYHDETSKMANWAIPKAHFLEAWGDLIYTDGTVSIQQPLIAPLYGAWSPIELLSMALQDEKSKGYDLVRGFWETQYKLKQAGGSSFDGRWRRWLHDGRSGNPFFGVHPTYIAPRGAGVTLERKQTPAPSERSLDVVFFADANLWDGRFANNSWLQEAPDPLTKICWDNAALVSPATAKTLNVKSEQLVSLEVGGKAVSLVAWILPGVADNTVAVALGYGRSFGNFLPYHPQGAVGFNVNPLRQADNPGLASGGKLSRGSENYPVACVQRYGSQEPGYGFEARPLVREADVAEYEENPRFAKEGIIEHGKAPPKALVIHPAEKTLHEGALKDVVDYTKGPQWGMAIDLNKCTGCNSCLVACVAENNIMAVGKDEVSRGRELHWIRMDRYFVGDENDPQVVHQPMPCQQCETAPCENVCPVAATTHSPDGLNDMAYNRCIGTRYCSNNCPFKVRRFNFYNYSKGQPEQYHMARNPNVTVRFRGVMEKCTYCVQRINAGKRKAKRAGDETLARAALDAITTACAQACPTDAIVFGDILSKDSEVARLKAQDRDYRLLSELNLRPRTSYLARVRNPNPKLVG